MIVKIILAVVVVLAATIGIVALLGSRLPVAHLATRSLILPVPPDSVFAVISDFAAAPGWRNGLTRVELAGGGGEPIRFTEIAGSDRLDFVVEAADAPARLVTRITGPGKAFGGAWAFRVEPADGGSRITISEHGEVYNPIFRFVSARIMGHTATIDRYLTDLARRFGAPPTLADGNPVPVSSSGE